MLTTGDSVDRYVIEAVLGEGGMGRVYRALDPRLGRRVALKVLLAQGSPAARAEAAARMVREARAAAAFNHPNVVAIYDVGDKDGAPYIAMELVTGQTLRAATSADPTISDAQKIRWLADVARGLAAAHRAGLVHRDIKPDNAMVTSDGVVKILDFGIARRADGDAAAVDVDAPTLHPPLPSITAEGHMIGTPQYMAPEQLRGEPLDGRCDEFAWGVMAWERPLREHGRAPRRARSGRPVDRGLALAERRRGLRATRERRRRHRERNGADDGRTCRREYTRTWANGPSVRRDHRGTTGP